MSWLYAALTATLLTAVIAVVVMLVLSAEQQETGPTANPERDTAEVKGRQESPDSGMAKPLDPAKPRPVSRSVDVATVEYEKLPSIVCDPSYTPTTRNNAANRMLNRGDPKLAEQLISMLRDKSEDLTWRNYCIQFLRGCYEQQVTRPQDSWEVSHAKILTALLEASEYREPELSSCATWSLAQLVSPKPWANALPGAAKMNVSLLPSDAETRTKELALKALRDGKAHLLVRTGGAQSCARMGLAEGAPDLRAISADGKEDLSIRTVAIAGLGQLKDEASRELLTRLASDPSPRLSQAAKMALNRLGTPPPLEFELGRQRKQ